jgi:gamma-glutamyltranspeptidase/glutathione hydrolase
LLPCSKHFATAGTVDSFYRGDIAQRLATELQERGAIATADDFAGYRAREVPPATIDWGELSIHTAPLTAGGSSTLQALRMLEELQVLEVLEGHAFFNRQQRNHALLESLRLAWADRFRYMGDIDHVDVPLDRLLSSEYARECADQVRLAVTAQRPIDVELNAFDQSGTINVSAADSAGNLVALTLTHGEAFGASVTIPEFGVTLGHGLSRFDPRPGFPNSIAPAKRPLNNMCPTVVLRAGRPVVALGGSGGRRIPSAMCGVLLAFAGDGRSLAEAVDAPRLHAEGDLRLTLDDACSPEQAAYLAGVGYEVRRAKVANLSAVSFDPANGATGAFSR